MKKVNRQEGEGVAGREIEKLKSHFRIERERESKRKEEKKDNSEKG